jgi:branched-chain amino acid transport system substrate-binding protein
VIRRFGLVAVTVMMVACSTNESSSSPDSSPRFSTTVPQPDEDGVLRFGLLVPQSGDGATLGEPLVAVANAAVRTINEAGGVLGRPVELVVADEGADVTTAVGSVDALVSDEGIDALIGPLSSNVALDVLPRLIESGVAVCSPGATAVSLASFPDDELFVRTTAPDGLAGQALAQLVAQTGVTNTVIAFPDDPFGRDLSEQIARALSLQGITIDVSIPFNPSDADYSDQVAQLTTTQPKVVTLVGDEESGGRFLRTVLEALPDATVVVNDALAGVDLTDRPDLVSNQNRSVVGVAVNSRAGRDEMVTYLGPDAIDSPPLAAALIDCFNLLALAADFSQSDVGAEFMPQVIAASRGGSACRTFVECATIIEAGLNIDYNGPTGVLSLDANGDPSVATFVTFGFDIDGRSSYRGDLGVFSAP